MSWPAACGSEIQNPHCLSPKPTDPNSWAFIPNLSAAPYNATVTLDKWVYAPQPSFYTNGLVPRYSGVMYNGEFLFCIYSTANQSCELADLPLNDELGSFGAFGNISEALNNNKFTIGNLYSVNGPDITVTIPDATYTVPTLYTALLLALNNLNLVPGYSGPVRTWTINSNFLNCTTSFKVRDTLLARKLGLQAYIDKPGSGVLLSPINENFNSSATGWEFVRNFNGSKYNRLECQISGQTPSGFSNIPNEQTGACEKSLLNGPGSECINPCVRLQNGNLAVNKSTQQCRVFPSTTTGGDASLGSTGSSCPTVCPTACVELWESCPAGTGPLTTLIQTKTQDDLMSLTGPYKLDGTPNYLWPTNYSNYAITSPPLDPILNKPYTECYSYNTAFCDLPLAWQETTLETNVTFTGPGSIKTIPQVTKCYAGCFPGTFPDPQNPKICLFVPLDGIYDPNTYSSSTPVQKVFCNPQYFNPVYWDSSNGIQKGCQALPLPSKQGSTCPQGTVPVINEFFNVEWCAPECPENYFFDITQNTCIAGCKSIANLDYVKFHDYVDIYASSKCKDIGVDGAGQPIQYECYQNQTLGHCPATNTAPADSTKFEFNQTTSPSQVPVKFNSINKQCSAKKAKDPSYSAYEAFKTFLNNTQQYQSSRKLNTNLGECPSGMVFGDPNCDENHGLCYDECSPGYEPIAYCANGADNCSDKVFGCRALCPSTQEGLGPWNEVKSGNLYTCAYTYPNQTAPTDPNLWVPCPDDGRYTVLDSYSTDVSVTLTQAARQEPLCIRNTYLRRSTCPLGFNLDNDKCISACDASEILVTLPSGVVVCQQGAPTSDSHEFDILALADSENAKSQFRHRVIRRKSFARGMGSDPNTSTDPVNTAPVFITIASIIVVAIIVLFLFKKK